MNEFGEGFRRGYDRSRASDTEYLGKRTVIFVVLVVAFGAICYWVL